MLQDVGKLRCRIAKVPLYYCRHGLKYIKNMIDETFTWLIDWCLTPTLSAFQLYHGTMILRIWWAKDEIWISGHFISVQNMRLSWHDIQKYMIFKHNRSFAHCWSDSLVIRFYTQLFPLQPENGIQSSMSKEKDNKFEYNFLVICKYLNLVKNQRIIS